MPQTKQDEKTKKFRENQQKLSVAKLSFPTVTNPKQENMTSPSPVDGICYKRMNSVILSLATKRKGGGVECLADFYSPSKRRKNFRSTLNYWEMLNKSESGILAEPCDPIMDIKDGDNRSGGSGGRVGGI